MVSYCALIVMHKKTRQIPSRLCNQLLGSELDSDYIVPPYVIHVSIAVYIVFSKDILLGQVQDDKAFHCTMLGYVEYETKNT